MVIAAKPSMEIRDFIESDVKKIADLFHDSIHAINTNIYSKLQQEAWAPTPPNSSGWEARLKAALWPFSVCLFWGRRCC